MLVQSSYEIYGEHAKKARILSGKDSLLAIEINGKDGKHNKQIFPLFINLMFCAALVGIAYNKTSIKISSEDRNASCSILPETLNRDKYNKRFKEIFQTVLVLDKEHNFDIKDIFSINKFDTSDANLKKYIEVFDSYVRGGIDKLYSEIIGDSPFDIGKNDVYFENYLKFIYNFNNLFNTSTSTDDMVITLRELTRKQEQ